ncbi:XRE family transcriptional regulator [Paraclostridium sordellii 8483]|uniref:helix-turn-helix domain-containing protein n=1 Tax=Paraclostridium sordellii TaxID=1505 RepID=UPI0002F2D179|nr:helix-turn-helix transcriptional regulator [Paeniclostridium sordellii]TAN66644.1 XRE family transcriptional regulator [Paeniclostridium sordellii 8483]
MLKFKRKSLGLSQKEVARMLHISPNTLSAIENKRYTDLHLDLINKICKLYSLDLIEFINWLES